MNYLEIMIKDHLLNTDINETTTKEIAQQFYVSRALVYKVINKLGYSSFESFKIDKQVFTEQKAIDLGRVLKKHGSEVEEIIIAIILAPVVYVIGLEETRASGMYLTRQLINLGVLAINIDDRSSISSYARIINGKDIIIYLSASGNVQEQKYLSNISCTRFVIAPLLSDLYTYEKKSIGFENNITNLSNTYERNSIAALIEKIELILSGVRIQTIKLQKNSGRMNDNSFKNR